MCIHSKELALLALNLGDLPHSIKAFDLITAPNERVFRSLTERDVLSEISEAILVRQATPLVANRFAMAASQSLLTAANSAGRKNLSYLLRFLPFVEHRSVFELFCSLLSNDENLQSIQESLRYNGFAKALLRHIDGLSEEGFNVRFAIGLFKMLPIVTACQVLCDDVTTAETVAIVLKEFNSSSPSLLNAQLAALNSVVNTMTPCLLIEYIPRIVGLLDPSAESLPPYRIDTWGSLKR
jgi:hypothetical protein